MSTYIIHRLLYGAFVVFCVITVVFFALHLAPGDPIDMLLPPDASGAAGRELADQLRRRYGLDQPIHVQYVQYLRRLASLDMGESIRSGRPVAGELLRLYPATIELTLVSLLIAGVIGISAGVLSAVFKRRAIDSLSMTAALVGVSIPNFVLGLLLMLLFALHLGWLPPSGRDGPIWSGGSIRYIILPAITLGTSAAAILARLSRSAMLDVLGEDYIRTARAKGLRARAVIARHAFRNAMIPIITVVGLQFGGLLAGAVIAETIFAWPGVGRFLIISITGNDFPAVQGAVLCIAVLFVLVNLLVDLTYAVIDPRIRY